MKFLEKYYPHLSAVAGFILISLIYFYPVLQGKEIFQSDIVQYTGMAKEQSDFRAENDAEPYWTNSAFGGMPTYQLGANYPHNYIKMLDSAIRFLPRPADYLFLYFLSFYVLLLILKTDPLKAFIGALAFGFSTYLIVILGVGHNAKAHAIGYMPLVIAGVILVFRKSFIIGGMLTMVAAALEISANHFQMTYYLLILLLPIAVLYIYRYINEKEYKKLLVAFGVFAIAGILAVGANAANLLATAEYTDFSMRGKSELTYNPDGTKDNTTSSMKYDYITEYSYGIVESFNLIAPRLFGGGNGEDLGPDSEAYKYAISQGVSDDEAKGFVASLPTYWGQQPIVAAPAYIGAVVFFLAILALFTDKRKIKYAFLAGVIISLLLSWGKNLPWLTNFFINYIPLYDKFRAVSSIQVVLELCMPVLAIMGLHSFFKEEDKARQWKSLRQSAGVALGIILLLFLCKGMLSFSGMHDEQMAATEAGRAVLDILIADRKSLYSADLLRSGVLILVSCLTLWSEIKNKHLFSILGVAIGIIVIGGSNVISYILIAVIFIWYFVKGKESKTSAVLLIGILMILDLVFVDKKYVSNDSKTFVSSIQIKQPFQPTAADKHILQDTTVYRVYEVDGRLQARTSYFHKSVGGYSAVRPRRLDQLFDYQISKSLDNLFSTIDTTNLHLTTSIPIINALNIKYMILQTNEGASVPVTNPFAYGNAWFINDCKFVGSADEEMKAIGTTDLRRTAVINMTDLKRGTVKPFINDSLALITVKTYKPNYIKYLSRNSNSGLAVFSEMYYPKGWNAFIDGNKATHFRADYTLRAMELPAGTHTIEFKFEPQVVQTGGIISFFSSIGILVLLIGGTYSEMKSRARNRLQN